MIGEARPAPAIRVVLADGCALFRDGLRAAVEHEPDLEVVAAVDDGGVAVDQARYLAPDVVVVNADLSGRHGRSCWHEIKAQLPATRVLVMGELADAEILLAAAQAGADGYLSKEVPLEQLLAALRQLARGHTFVPAEMLGPLLRALVERARVHDGALERLSRLTRREREVLCLLVDGLGHHDIAQHLTVSPHTARAHVRNVLGKLEVHSRVEAVAWVLEHHLLGPLGAGDEEGASEPRC